jgi:hypothetical protein
MFDRMCIFAHACARARAHTHTHTHTHTGQALSARIQEQKELQNGAFAVPDLTNKKNVVDLRLWKTGNVDQVRE